MTALSLESPFCLRCNHAHSKYDGKCIVNLKTHGRDCQCDADSFVPDSNNPAFKNERYYLNFFAGIKTVTERVQKTILTIEGARDLPDWKFVQCCWRYWLGFKVGDMFSAPIEQLIFEEAQPDTITRCRRKICEDELKTLMDFQTRLENTKDFSESYWNITQELKKFWTESKYVPKNIEYLKAKGIKQSAIFEWSIQELNDIT